VRGKKKKKKKKKQKKEKKGPKTTIKKKKGKDAIEMRVKRKGKEDHHSFPDTGDKKKKTVFAFISGPTSSFPFVQRGGREEKVLQNHQHLGEGR